MRQYLIAQLKAAMEPDDLALQAKLTEAFGLVIGQTRPVNFRPESSDLIEMEKGWHKLCVTLAECDCPNPQALTIYQLYIWLESLEEKFEAFKKNNPPNGTKRK